MDALFTQMIDGIPVKHVVNLRTLGQLASDPSLQVPTASLLNTLGYAKYEQTDKPQHLSHQMVCEETPILIGDTWVQQWSVTDKPLAEIIQMRCSEVDAFRNEYMESYPHDFGGEYGVLHLQLRDVEDRTNWLTLDAAASKLVATGHGDILLGLRTEENVILQLQATELSGVLMSMSAYGSAVMSASWQIKDMIRSLTTVAEVLSFDVQAAWPNG